LYEGTFFEQFKKPLFDILAIIKCAALELTISKTIQYLKFEESELCRKTIGKIFKSLRNVCTISLDKINLKLGGRNQTIQIDESIFAKVKHFVGKDLVRKQVWVFRMVDVKPDQIYFECVKDRTAQTLLSVIYDHLGVVLIPIVMLHIIKSIYYTKSLFSITQ
jgi:hypothetical protein